MLQVLRSLRDWHTCGCMMQHLAGRFGSYMMQQTLDGQTCSCVTASDWSRTSPELPALEGRELFTAGCDPLSAASTSAAASAPLRRPAKHKQICPNKHLQRQPLHCCTSVRTTFSHIWGNRCILAHLHHTCTGCPPLVRKLLCTVRDIHSGHLVDLNQSQLQYCSPAISSTLECSITRARLWFFFSACMLLSGPGGACNNNCSA